MKCNIIYTVLDLLILGNRSTRRLLQIHSKQKQRNKSIILPSPYITEEIIAAKKSVATSLIKGENDFHRKILINFTISSMRYKFLLCLSKLCFYHVE